MRPVKQPNLTRKFPLTDMPTGREVARAVGHRGTAAAFRLAG